MKTTVEQRECLIELLKGVQKLDNPLWLHHIEQIQWAFSDIEEQAGRIEDLQAIVDKRDFLLKNLIALGEHPTLIDYLAFQAAAESQLKHYPREAAKAAASQPTEPSSSSAKEAKS
ncbi:hypothetical protein LCGC14_2026090 [marine sediment metagenome]|uniref:Uncharacterized protein n=1 Tax=marine sediment metagenome TaxID=412755 RepID=A0A0F9EWA7_9ZZZZ|nr:hypothetical protein [Actinomycetota bacterium]